MKSRNRITLFLSLMFLMSAFALQARAQEGEFVLNGTVKGTNGEGIIGATVKVENSSQGVITDLDGNFTIKVSLNSKLNVSYIGYITQVMSVKGNTPMNIVLKEDQKSLDEVIVVGYGSVKKSNLTSSVSKISNEAMENRPVANVSEAMQGQLAGVNAQATGGGLPGQELTMRIRGVNTITGDSSPLYVIDGVPRDDMNDISPSDIASIQILKDASATAIYGSRGANGVVLIETKTGTGKPTVTFNAYYGLQTAEKELDLMSGEEWVAYNMWYRNAQYLRSGGSMSDAMSTRPVQYRYPDWWSTFTDFTNWQRVIMQTAPMQSYEASASASGDIGSVFFSLGYTSQEGIIKHTDYDRLNSRINATLNLAKNVKLGMNVSFSNSTQNLQAVDKSDRNGKESAVHHALMMSPLIPVGATVRSDKNQSGSPGTSTVSDADYGSFYIDPLARLETYTDQTKATRVQSSIWGEWKMLPELTYKINYSYNYDGETWEYFYPKSTNRSRYQNEGGSTSSRTNDWVIQNTLTFDKQMGNHNLNVLLGQSAERRKYYIATLTATGWPYENVTTLNQATTYTNASTERTTYTNASFFGRVSYNYLDRYLFTASLRRDGSSRFGQNTKWGTFPSVSVGWKINEESFLRNANWINLLKIRASYGTSGNDRIGDFEYVSILQAYNSAYGNQIQSGAAGGNLANPDLKWEQTRSFDLGFDFSAFHNRLQFNFDYYVNTTNDLLYYISVPRTTGFESALKNIGKIRNTGWEIDVTSHNIDKGGFKWNTNLNLSHNSNEVLALGEGVTKTISSINGGNFITQVGGEVSQFYIYRTDGILTAEDIANGVAIYPGQQEGGVKFVDSHKDGVINEEDRVAYGSNLPDLTWGLTNRFSYKNFELSVLLQGQFGGDIMFLGARHYDCGFPGRTNFSRWIHSYKTSLDMQALPTEYMAAHGINMDFDGKTYSPFGGGPDDNDTRIYDATYLRIKNVTLSYTFPKKMLRKVHINSLRVYGSVDNVYTFTDYPGFTPETSSYGNGTTQLGIDYSTYPLSRRYTLGVNLVF